MDVDGVRITQVVEHVMQNLLVALDCEARIVRARSEFQRIRIAIGLTPATHCHALAVGGR